MDEKVGKNPNHKCVCKDTHPGMGPHRDCKERNYHLCGCGRRSSLENPDHWVSREDARNAGNFLVGMMMAILDPAEHQLLRTLQSLSIEKRKNEKPHYHAFYYGEAAGIHVCLGYDNPDEEVAAVQAAKIADACGLSDIELLHVGGGEDAFHSAKVVNDGTVTHSDLFGSLHEHRRN